MTKLLLRFRGPLVAVVALLLTATVAFAAQPTGSQAPRGHDRTQAGQTVSTSDETTETDQSSETDTSETDTSETDTSETDTSETDTSETDTSETDTSETDTSETDTSDSSEAHNCTTDPTGLTDQQLAAMTHGSIVCWAAHQPTPDGYANHGAWVSHWAHWGKGGNGNAKGKSHKPSN